MKTGPRMTTEPELFGLKEVAEACNVRRGNVATLSGLPKPYDKIASTTLWRAAEIRKFAAERNSRLGRPALDEAA